MQDRHGCDKMVERVLCENLEKNAKLFGSSRSNNPHHYYYYYKASNIIQNLEQKVFQIKGLWLQVDR